MTMMIADKLRKSILQAAIQGKLTEQLPTDGDARELLEKIRAEKQRLIKEKKIKKESQLPAISDEEIPFDIPDNWCWCRLGDCAFTINDGTHSRPHYTTNGIPFLSVKDMSNGHLDFRNTKFISQKDHDELKKRCFPQYNDLMITKVGTTGIPVLVDTYEEFSLFVSVALIKYPQNLIYPKFLQIVINSPFVQKQVENSTKGVGNKNWVIRDIKNTVIILPPFDEQLRIVEKVDELMTELNSLEKDEQILNQLQNDFPKRLKSSLLQAAIQGKLTEQLPDDGDARDLLKSIQQEKEKLIKEKKLKPEKPLPPISDDEIPFDIPDNWCWVRLGTIIKLLSGQDFIPQRMCQ